MGKVTRKSLFALAVIVCAGTAVNAAVTAQWLLDEGGSGGGDTAYDSAGYGNNMVIETGSTAGQWLYENSQYGTGFSFNGTQRFEAVRSAGGFPFDFSGDFSISADIHTSSGGIIFATSAADSWAYNGKRFEILGGKVYFQSYGRGALSGTTNIQGALHNVMVTYDSSESLLSLYVDGELDASGTLTLYSDSYNAYLGGLESDGELLAPLSGILSNVQISDVVLPEPATVILFGFGALSLFKKRK
ncbi:hypothetical protein SMSP2_01389 [Limihaloglobus sulfuriphilus]|uniref:PEP-CTERM protein-sorting domain-containing protein n=1 Tax=Limihaloglobus sulfuriphilus TaxID=1851148 RepID=A0A1Q2MEA0_9BACT|nr:LamG-like jellyroll fold domain-containing protein [Limihaloglobus sulfuriphilus]AQQ71025.1 hypothetical protein SMSP2_01389 [Limihaloglobus sulfuriphilus]